MALGFQALGAFVGFFLVCGFFRWLFVTFSMEASLDSTRRLASQVAERRLEDVKWRVSWDVFMPEEQMDEVPGN